MAGTMPVTVPSPDLSTPEAGPVAFRRGTTEKVNILTGESLTQLTTLQRINRTVEGNGYMFGIVLDVQAVTAANTAATTFVEDAPFTALDSVVLHDVGGDLVNVGGYDMYIANLAGRQYAGGFQDTSAQLFTLTPGNAAAGGSYKFMVRVPSGLNRRTLSGLVGNQDRATKYQLRTDLAASASIWATAPTSLPTVTIDKYYEEYTVPAPEVVLPNRSRVPQQQAPSDYGRLHFITASDTDAAPTASSTKNHYIQRLGNTIRSQSLIFRAGTGTTPRALAANNVPTAITFKIGDDTIFTENWRYRQWLMGERYGIDAFPAGVLCYDNMHDLLAGSGSEVGDDYYFTQGLNNAQFVITYPSGFTSGGSLHVITDDLQEVEPAA